MAIAAILTYIRVKYTDLRPDICLWLNISEHFSKYQISISEGPLVYLYDHTVLFREKFNTCSLSTRKNIRYLYLLSWSFHIKLAGFIFLAVKNRMYLKIVKSVWVGLARVRARGRERSVVRSTILVSLLSQGLRRGCGTERRPRQSRIAPLVSPLR